MDRDILQAINAEVQKAILDSQNTLLNQMNTLVTDKLQNMQQCQKELAESQFNKLQEEFLVNDGYRFKRKSCEDQFKFYVKINSVLKDTKCVLENEVSSAACEAKKKISEGIDLVHQRRKLIRIADSSEFVWRVVQEYTANPVASDSEDDKKITRAENKAERKVKAEKKKKSSSRFKPYAREPGSSQSSASGTRVKPGVCYKCFKPGHWQRECTATENVPKKISTKFDYACSKAIDVTQDGGKGLYSEVGHNSVHNVNTPVGRLKKASEVWRLSGAIDNIMSVIHNGYALPFKDLPEVAHPKNNKSARDNPLFVNQEIDKLLDLGCITEVANKPLVINPLTVAYSRSGKARLVLDCRHINLNLHKFKFKFEDVAVAKDMFHKGYYVFKFDLKSAYHHVEILPLHRTYLGFSWLHNGIEKYFVYNVLPFGISVAGYIFSKVLREVVKYWRSLGHKVIMYLDDGFGGATSYEEARILSSFIKTVCGSLVFSSLKKNVLYGSPHRTKLGWVIVGI